MAKEIRKKTRFHFFQMVINMKSVPGKSFSELSNNDILKGMSNSDFVTQQLLEDLLFKGSIRSKNTFTEVIEYKGQLELGETLNRPHWQVFLETSRQTTPKSVVEYFSKAIFNQNQNPSIQVTAIKNVKYSSEYVMKDERLILPDSCWFPGRFTKESISFRKQLEGDEVMMEIYSNPRIYQKYINNIIRGPSNDRLVYWVMDFLGYTGKSKYASFLESSGKAIVIDIDNPRAFSKAFIKLRRSPKTLEENS